jgi:outer membrane lipoprotein-sorting protein
MVTLIASSLVLGVQAKEISSYFAKGFEDLSFTSRVVKGDQKELVKINDDFGQAYRFSSSSVRMKEPYMLRIDAKVEETRMSYILSGTTQLMSVPNLRLKQRTNLSDKPGRRQTALDFGFLTPSLFDGSLYTATFVRADRATGASVFDIGYAAKYNDKSRHRIWIDPSKHYIIKREWYNRTGTLLATFAYENPVEKKGMWFPTLMTVRNVDNVVAGQTRYEDLKVNVGIEESVFSTK